jgi:fibronectin-binding autotransporter adhesin
MGAFVWIEFGGEGRNRTTSITYHEGGIMHTSTTRVFAAAAILAFVGQAMAISWTDPTGGSFQDGANWIGGVAPGVADLALFDLIGGTYTVNFTGNANNSQLIIGRDDVTFDLGSFVYDLALATPESIFVGEIASDNAVLTLTNGTLSGVDLTIGQVVGSVGELNVPTGGTLTVTDDLWIGEAGTGSMNVTGGTVNSVDIRIAQDAGSFGDVLLTGATTVWTNANSLNMTAGNSSLTVENGAVLNTTFLEVANTFTSVADVILDGPTSQINVTGSVFNMSGINGISTFIVRNGADLTSGNANIGNIGIGTDAQFTITGPGSTWISSGNIAAGLRGDAPGGVMRIENGAVVTSVTGSIGQISDGQGAAYIDGPGSQWNMSGDLDVGVGAAILTITNGGSVSSDNGVIGSADPTRPIDILVDGPGSTWANTGAITGGSGATMTIQNGGVVTSDSADINATWTLDGVGSRWDITNSLTMSNFPAPSGTVSNGAVLTSNGGDLGRAEMLVSGGTWTNTGTLTLNHSTQSDLRITDGGVVTNLATVLADTAGRIANVTVEGVSSAWWVNGDLTIGNAGDDGFGSGGEATLAIRDGALVLSNNVSVATTATGTGTIILENKETYLNVSGNLILGGPDLVTVGGTADLTIASGAIASVGAMMKVHAGSNVQLLGGTLEVASNDVLDVDNADDFDFHFGTLRYTDMANFSLADMQMILGIVPILGTAQTIDVAGLAELNTSLIIDGGTFSVGMLQGASDPLFISGTLSLTNDSIYVGVDGLLGTNLTLQSNRVLNVGNFVAVHPDSVLTVDQTTMTAGSLTNNGEVVLNGASAFLGGGSMDNMGRLTGNGRLGLSLTNTTTGTVLLTSGDHLIAEGGQNFNSGRFDLAGGTIEFTQYTQNNTDGLFIGQGTIISRSSFVNDGDMAFSGATNFIGDIENRATGLILVTGVGPTTFYDDLTHDGVIDVSLGATAVYLGTVSGSGTYPGPGTNRFEADFTPGTSPGDIAFGGDIVLTGTASLEIELAGIGGVPGVDFDRLNITGDMNLDGTMVISMIGGYTPSLGDSFQVLIAGSRTGMFDSVLGTDIGGGLAFDVLYGLNDVTLEVISTALVGDLNADGFVGIADLNIVLGNWNQTIPPGDPLADPSGDNFVGIADLNVVLGNWNAGTPPGKTSNIPEPTTGIIGLVIVLFGITRHRG